MSVSRGIHILRQLVPLVVVSDRDIPVFQYGLFVSPRYVCLALLVDVVYVYEFVVVVDVAGIVEGIFHIDLGAEFLCDVIFKHALCERVAVPQPFAPSPHVVDDSSRDAPFRGVVVEIGFPLAAWQISLQARISRK